MKGLTKKGGLYLAAVVTILIMVSIQVSGATLTSHLFRLSDSIEYMDKTYVFFHLEIQVTKVTSKHFVRNMPHLLLMLKKRSY